MGAVKDARTGYGWPVLTSSTKGSPPRLRKFVLPGTNRHLLLRDGSVGFLLCHFALWWHDRISRLDGGTWDEWGWASRPVREQNDVMSEHAGGCAADLDATQYPRGVSIWRVMSKGQIVAIRLRLKFYGGALGWGGDYNRTPDGMHIEIAKGTDLAKCERVARRLLNTPRGRKILKANPGLREVILS